MTIAIEWNCGEDVREAYEPMIRRMAELVLEAEQCPFEAEISIVLTDDEEICQVNREFRQVDGATDVLSFPMQEYDEPGDFSGLIEEAGCFHPETGELLLGDIMLSIERARAQAEEYGHSLEREVAFLIVHSMLHLCGYDHMEEEERERMEERQRLIMELAKIPR